MDSDFASPSEACHNRFCKENADLRAKLVAFRDVAEDVFEQLDMAAGTETGMLSYNMVGDCSARLGDAIDAIDSAKDVKP